MFIHLAAPHFEQISVSY